MSLRPSPEDFAPYYAGYVDKVPSGDVLEILRAQLRETPALFESVPAAKHAYRYAPDKWSIQEVLGHMVDTERVFAYRTLRIARGDETPLPGMDQDEFMAGVDFDGRGLASLLEEYRHLRASNIALFASFDDEVLARRGTASDCTFTVRALLYIIAGHEIHHLGVLRERYL